jgi:hypothetical protein
VAAARAQARLDSRAAASEAGADLALRLAAERETWPEATGIDTHDRERALSEALDATAPHPGGAP